MLLRKQIELFTEKKYLVGKGEVGQNILVRNKISGFFYLSLNNYHFFFSAVVSFTLYSALLSQREEGV